MGSKAAAGRDAAAGKASPDDHVHRGLRHSLQESQTALRQSREELRALTASLLDTIDSERRYVARELHDDLAQKVAHLVFNLETALQTFPSSLEKERKLVATARDDIFNLVDEIRRIAHQLHPSLLNHLGLVGAVRSFTREFERREEIPIRLVLRGVPKQIPGRVACSLYCIIQEALRNIAKHAGKTTSAVTLTGSRNHLEIRIEDKGIGFDPNTPVRGGLGLISMRERARLMNGNFSLTSKPGKGVRIKVQVPLKEKLAK